MSQFNQAPLNPNLLLSLAKEQVCEHALVAIGPRSGEDQGDASTTNQATKSGLSLDGRRPRLPLGTTIRRTVSPSMTAATARVGPGSNGHGSEAAGCALAAGDATLAARTTTAAIACRKRTK